MQRVCKSNISYYCTLYWIGFCQNLLTPSTLKNKHSHVSDRFFQDANILVAYVQLSDFSSVMLGCLPSF